MSFQCPSEPIVVLQKDNPSQEADKGSKQLEPWEAQSQARVRHDNMTISQKRGHNMIGICILINY